MVGAGDDCLDVAAATPDQFMGTVLADIEEAVRKPKDIEESVRVDIEESVPLEQSVRSDIESLDASI